MKSIGYILLIALFGLVILDTPPQGEFNELEIKEIQFEPQEYKEVQESRRQLEEVMQKVEKNHQYIEHTIKQYGSTTQVPNTAGEASN